MSLKWPIFLLLIVLLPIAAWLVTRKPRKKLEAKFLAESETLEKLPSYQKIVRRHQMAGLAEKIILSLLFLTFILIASRPTKTIQKIDEENSRDIVMCMDASGSMKESIPEALATMKEVVEQNPYDRYAITLFQTQAYSAVPLTRDIAAINQTIDDLTEGFNATITGTDGNQINAFNAYDYLGYVSGGSGGTDVGAGMAGCINRFGDLELERSRHLIMISDLEHNGEIDPIKIGQLIPRYDIKMYVIAPRPLFGDTINQELIDITGASYGEFADDTAIQEVLADVYDTILNRNEVRILATVDNPYPYWLLALVLSWAWVGLIYLREHML